MLELMLQMDSISPRFFFVSPLPRSKPCAFFLSSFHASLFFPPRREDHAYHVLTNCAHDALLAFRPRRRRS